MCKKYPISVDMVDMSDTIVDMATGYTKLFGSILDSTIWHESLPVKVVWITMLAMADREGEVSASVPGLAYRAGVSVSECEEALGKFLGPDPYSRTREAEGRRIELVSGGWRLLNHAKYRAMLGKEERREYQRVKQAEYRAAKRRGLRAPTAEEAVNLKVAHQSAHDAVQELNRQQRALEIDERDKAVAEANAEAGREGAPA